MQKKCACNSKTKTMSEPRQVTNHYYCYLCLTSLLFGSYCTVGREHDQRTSEITEAIHNVKSTLTMHCRQTESNNAIQTPEHIIYWPHAFLIHPKRRNAELIIIIIQQIKLAQQRTSVRARWRSVERQTCRAADYRLFNTVACLTSEIPSVIFTDSVYFENAKSIVIVHNIAFIIIIIISDDVTVTVPESLRCRRAMQLTAEHGHITHWRHSRVTWFTGQHSRLICNAFALTDSSLTSHASEEIVN